MRQLIIPDFEDFSPNPLEIIESLKVKGYHWLTDWNSGALFTRDFGCGHYVPYRIEFPSGKILDEEEIFNDFSELRKKGFCSEEIQLARNLYFAVNDDRTPKDMYEFSNYSFVSEEDEILTKEKYKKNPFYLEK